MSRFLGSQAGPRGTAAAHLPGTTENFQLTFSPWGPATSPGSGRECGHRSPLFWNPAHQLGVSAVLLPRQGLPGEKQGHETLLRTH